MRHDYQFPRTSREAFGIPAQSWQFDEPRKPDWHIAVLLAVMAAIVGWVL